MYNVLIADDDVDTWFPVNAMLRRHHVKASVTSNLSNARKCMETQRPSLAFLDNHLLNNAPDFIQSVKTKYPQLKIILVNGASDKTTASMSRADLVINKPIIPEMIERAIKKLLQPLS